MKSRSNYTSVMSILYIVVGIVLLFFALDAILKIAFIVVGIWLIFYGFALRGQSTKYMVQRYLFKFFN